MQNRLISIVAKTEISEFELSFNSFWESRRFWRFDHLFMRQCLNFTDNADLIRDRATSELARWLSGDHKTNNDLRSAANE